VVDRFARLPFTAVAVAGEIGFGVLDTCLDVPQPVGAQVALADDAPGVDVFAADGWGRPAGFMDATF